LKSIGSCKEHKQEVQCSVLKRGADASFCHLWLY
jgi:hypothetical protein